MHDVIKLVCQYAAYFMEAVAVVFILGGSGRAIVLYAKGCMVPARRMKEFNLVRLRVGHSLSLGLEFLIGADILKSAVSPSWEDLGKLAAIVAIRCVINFLLVWEIRHTESASILPAES